MFHPIHPTAFSCERIGNLTIKVKTKNRDIQITLRFIKTHIKIIGGIFVHPMKVKMAVLKVPTKRSRATEILGIITS